MQSVVLLAVLGVWVAVIVPPLMRNRSEHRPNSSVSDFRRQLSTLQRTVPTRSMAPMRGMARPLTQAPHQHHRTQVSMSRHGAMQSAGLPRSQSMGYGTPDVRRAPVGHQHHRQAHIQRVSPREMQRRRRANVLFVLAVATGISGFLAATTKTDPMIWSFAISFMSLCGYCYKLVQIRNMELHREWSETNWFNAA